MTAAKVLAPLVLVKNRIGEIGYHYRGTVISWLSDADFARLAADGMVCAAEAPAVLAPEPVVTASESVPVPRPAKAHAKELWVEYAVSKGWDREVANSTNKTALVAALTEDDDEDQDEDNVPAAESVDESDTDEVTVPKKAGLLEDWQAYARSKGLPDADIEGMEKQELIELLT